MNNQELKLEFEYEPRPARQEHYPWLHRVSKYKPTVDAMILTATNGNSATITPGADWPKLLGTLRGHLKRAGYRLVTQRRLDGKISAWTEPIQKNGDEHNAERRA